MEQFILIHGALGRKSEFDKIIPFLEKEFKVILYEIPHHGEAKDVDVPFTVTNLVDHFLNFLETVGPSYVYGLSLGGYIALSAAQIKEDNIKGIVAQATKLNWSIEEAEKETKGLNVDFLSTNARGFYEYLLGLHGDYLPQLLNKTAQFMTALGEHPLISPKTCTHLSLPIRFIRGGKDRMVTKEETLEIVNSIATAHYTEIPSMIHPLGFLKPKYIAQLLSTQIKSMEYQCVDTPYGRMAYHQLGIIKSDDQPIVLFLHESLGSIAQWGNFPKNLCQQLQLPGIVIEFPGYGFSDKEDKVRDNRYLHEFSWEVLPSFLASLKLENPLIIVGHSDGGTNALLYSSKYPNKVKAIITMAAHYINEKETIAGIRPAIDAYNEGKLKGLEFYHGEKTERLFFAWCNTWLLPDFKDWDISQDLQGNKVPALIIQGDKDQYGTAQQLKGIVELLENAKPYIVADCGHAPHLEKEKEVIKIIDEWMTHE